MNGHRAYLRLGERLIRATPKSDDVTEEMKRAGAFAGAAHGHPSLYHPDGEMLEEIYLAMRRAAPDATPKSVPDDVSSIIQGLHGTIAWIRSRDPVATNWLYLTQAIAALEALNTSKGSAAA